MSSIIGHTLIGAAIGYRRGDYRPIERILLGAYAAFLAALPDLDYLIFWVGGYEIEPRYTHSIGFCLSVSVLAIAFNRLAGIKPLASLEPPHLILIPLSHLVLDYLVGVHKSPFLWPLSSEVFTSRIGILPSAGSLNILNGYFWRNLSIEILILLPISFYIALRDGFGKISPLSHLCLVVAITLGCLFGLGLSR